MDLLTLDFEGFTIAVLMGVILLIAGLNLGALFVIIMLYFLILSAIVTRLGTRYKKKIKLYERTRGVKNVVANGTVPVIMAIIYYFARVYGFHGISVLLIIGFVSSAAAITADKFGSEIGVLNGAPRTIFTLKKAQKGTSGAITTLGLLAGLFGSFMISLMIVLVTKSTAMYLITAIISITIAGISGSLVDSMLGYFEERGTGNKYTSNVACAITGAVVGMFLFLVLLHL